MPTEEQFVSHIDFGDGVVRTIKDPNASGTAVVGVKGDAEESYRSGNVNITKGNIGLDNVENLKQVSATENQGLTDTEKDYARGNLGLGTAAVLHVPSSGDASNTEVVLGSDSRLSDARQASDVYSWAKASTKPSYTAAEVGAVDVAMAGVAGGIAELDSLGKVPASQLPAYVDDVLEYANLSSFPATGESGKIYVAQDTNKTYRWSGSSYVVISETLALGETSSTAYRGDRGKTAYNHSQITSGNPHHVTAAEVGAQPTQPFNLAISGTSYGYYKTDGTTFVAFKSQADIDAAVAAAKVGNAAAGDVLSGKTFTNSTTSGVTGTMTNNGAVAPSGLNCGGSYSIPAGYHNGSGKVTANSLASQTGVDSGKTAVTAGAMLSGYQGWVNGSKISGTMSSKAAATYNTSTSDQTIAASQYLSGAQTIKAVTTANIAAANIKTGVTIKVGDANDDDRIAGVAGTFTAASTVSSGQTAAAAGQLLSGYSAWVGGSEIKGSIASKAAATYNTSTSDQTIAASQYLSGAQTIKAVTTANIAAANIKTGVTIKVGDANSATRIKNVAGTFTAASTVSSGQTAAAAAQLLTGYSAWVGGSEIKGSMANKGAVSQSLSAGTLSYTVPAGYHNGSGKVSVTKGVAKIGTTDKTWASGGSVSLTCGQSLSVGAGVYYAGTVSAASLASQTGVDSGKTAVTAGTMVSGYQGWVNGSKITGTFAGQEKSTTPTTRSATAATITPNSGKYLTKVTVNTNSVPNSNSGTYTPTSNGSALDMGATNTYRYVNTGTVYNLGRIADLRYIALDCGNATSSVYTYSTQKTTGLSKKIYFPYGGKFNGGSYASGDAVLLYDASWNVIGTYALNTFTDNTAKTVTVTTAIAYIGIRMVGNGSWKSWAANYYEQ